jgi:hypothetical protein
VARMVGISLGIPVPGMPAAIVVIMSGIALLWMLILPEPARMGRWICPGTSGSGSMIGSMQVIMPLRLPPIHRVHPAERIGCCGAARGPAVGAMLCRIIATGTILPILTSVSAFAVPANLRRLVDLTSFRRLHGEANRCDFRPGGYANQPVKSVRSGSASPLAGIYCTISSSPKGPMQ